METFAAIGVNEIACLIDLGSISIRRWMGSRILRDWPSLRTNGIAGPLIWERIHNWLLFRERPRRTHCLAPPEKRALLAARLARSSARFTGSCKFQPGKGRSWPLSHTQRSVWFLNQLYPGNVAYNSPIAVRFTGRLNPRALEWSLNELVRRHELLRTVFELRDGDAVQYAKPFRPVRLRRMEFGHLPESERMEAAREEAVREAQQPFDLAIGPPWRAKLLCCSEREHMLVVILHHIICDGWSIGILVRELVAGYEAFLSGETSPLPELPLQYPTMPPGNAAA